MDRSVTLVRDQILVLISKDFKLKYNSTALGFFWSLLVPFCMSVIYYFVFGVMMRWDAKNYLLYLLSGNFLWQYFASIVMQNGSVLISNASLLKKTSFRYDLLLWGTFFSEGIHFLLTLIVLFGVMLFYHVIPEWGATIVNSLVLLIGFPLFAMGISYIYAALNMYFRDLERIMNVFITLWMFGSPVFIPITAVPEKYLWVYRYNPMAGFLGIFRDIFYEPGLHPVSWCFPLLSGIVLFILGKKIFDKASPWFAERI